MVSGNSRTSVVREPGEHKVTFTVTIACAVQAGNLKYIILFSNCLRFVLLNFNRYEVDVY